MILVVLLSLLDFMGRGVSHDLAEHRARTISQVEYDLALDVTARDSAVGRVTMRFALAADEDVILDFRGRRLVRASANGRCSSARRSGRTGDTRQSRALQEHALVAGPFVAARDRHRSAPRFDDR